MIRGLRIMRPGAALLALVFALLSVAPALAVHEDPNQQHDFADSAFQRTWARTDKPVADGTVQRTWMWGPEPYTPGMQEDYANSPGGKRLVQYFDKSRMEINNPNATDDGLWYVTNGLLVVEMVDGKIQTGDAQFDDSPEPADIPIAGDPGGNSPTYADIAEYGLRAKPALSDGATITQTLDASGSVTTDNAYAQYNVTAAQRVTVPGIDHQVASVFWTFMNSTGTVWENGATTTAQLFQNPYYATGYPITDAYWTKTNVAGTEHDVLWQCFERRCLTYTPGNNAGFQVEAGNVGQHYYMWRYPQTPPAATETLFVATLAGDQEAPDAVDTQATGNAVFCVSQDGASIDFQVTVQGITEATAAHIHTGAAGTSGDVIVPLYTTSGTESFSGDGVLAEGTITATDLPAGMTIADLAQQLAGGDTYVNVHTNANPAGEIRGQIAVADDIQLSATLSGAGEVPAVTTDAAGTATFTYDRDTHSLQYQLDVTNLTGAAAAHIHLGAAGANGNVVAPLFSSDTPMDVADGTLASGEITDADLVNDLQGMTVEELVCQMLMGNTYTNVHTTANQGGEIRGQNMWGALPPAGAAQSYSVTFGALNDSNVTGTATLTLDGDQLTVAIAASGLEPDQTHPVHIHGFTDGTIATCPTPANDGPPADGVISLEDGVPAYGDVLLPLDPMLVADADGNATLDKTFTLTAEQMAALGDSLADNVVTIHGKMTAFDQDGDGTTDEYEPLLPVACGLVAADDATMTFESDLSGANLTPPVDTTATGAFTLRMDAGGSSASWQLSGQDFDENATDAHIHDAATGDVLYILWFTEGMPFTDTGQIGSGSITAADANFNTGVTFDSLMASIAAGETYVDVHTAESMDGYISGDVYAYGMDDES